MVTAENDAPNTEETPNSTPDLKCERCGEPISVGTWPFCPHGGGANSVIPDDIPGGIWIRHGICNPDGTPKKYYSKSEMTRAAAAADLVQGGDGSNPYRPNVNRKHFS